MMGFGEIFIFIYAFIMIGIILYYSWVHCRLKQEIKKEQEEIENGQEKLKNKLRNKIIANNQYGRVSKDVEHKTAFPAKASTGVAMPKVKPAIKSVNTFARNNDTEETVINNVDFTVTRNGRPVTVEQLYDEYHGNGGNFGGAGASQSWDEPSRSSQVAANVIGSAIGSFVASTVVESVVDSYDSSRYDPPTYSISGDSNNSAGSDW